jgi:hypothetical protein
MKFFNFDGEHIPYYALIGADSEEAAFDCYCEAVCEPENEAEKEDWLSCWPAWGQVKELTAEQTINNECIMGNATPSSAEKYFKETIEDNPCLIGIAGDLL